MKFGHRKNSRLHEVWSWKNSQLHALRDTKFKGSRKNSRPLSINSRLYRGNFLPESFGSRLYYTSSQLFHADVSEHIQTSIQKYICWNDRWTTAGEWESRDQKNSRLHEICSWKNSRLHLEIVDYIEFLHENTVDYISSDTVSPTRKFKPKREIKHLMLQRLHGE